MIIEKGIQIGYYLEGTTEVKTVVVDTLTIIIGCGSSRRNPPLCEIKTTCGEVHLVRLLEVESYNIRGYKKDTRQSYLYNPGPPIEDHSVGH